MSIFDVFMMGIALSMDAVAVSMTNGMLEPKMRMRKALLIALFFGVFQAVMPLLGYYGSAAFSDIVAIIAPWVSFFLLTFIGGKAIFDHIREKKESSQSIGRNKLVVKQSLSLGKLFMQAIATSIDALAIGVSLLAQDTLGALPFSVFACVGIIGCVTFLLSAVSVQLGKSLGDALSENAEAIGGFVLIVIGLRLLLESFI